MVVGMRIRARSELSVECGSVCHGKSIGTSQLDCQCNHRNPRGHLRNQERPTLAGMRTPLRGLSWLVDSVHLVHLLATCSSPCNLNPVALARIRTRLGTPNASNVGRFFSTPSPRSPARLGHPRPPSALQVPVAELARRHPASTGSYIGGGGPPRYCPSRSAGGMAAIESADTESMAQRDTDTAARPLSHTFLRATADAFASLTSPPRPIVGPAGGRRAATTRAHWSPVRLADPLISRASGGGGPQKGTRWEARTGNA